MADIPLINTTTDTPVAFFKRRGGKVNLRKRIPTPPPATDTRNSDSDSDYSSSEEAGNTGAKLPSKKRKLQHVVSSSSSIKPINGDGQVVEQVTQIAEPSRTIAVSDDATKRSNWHNENEEEYLLRKRGGNKKGTTTGDEESTVDDGVYRGGSQYKSFIKKNPDSLSNKGKMGPVKAPTNVRQIVTVDYAPDVCKDYKQTGFCGFGDTCKFLHAREDYKQGWELDRDWEIKGKASGTKKVNNKANGGDESDSDSELEGIPFACVICKKEYKTPIMTKCGHYFCEKCALSRYRKNPSCAICGAGTNGIFNAAKGLQKKLDRKRERLKAKKEEEDGEGSDDEVPEGNGGIIIDDE